MDEDYDRNIEKWAEGRVLEMPRQEMDKQKEEWRQPFLGNLENVGGNLTEGEGVGNVRRGFGHDGSCRVAFVKGSRNGLHATLTKYNKKEYACHPCDYKTLDFWN